MPLDLACWSYDQPTLPCKISRNIQYFYQCRCHHSMMSRTWQLAFGRMVDCLLVSVCIKARWCNQKRISHHNYYYLISNKEGVSMHHNEFFLASSYNEPVSWLQIICQHESVISKWATQCTKHSPIFILLLKLLLSLHSLNRLLKWI